MLGERYFTRARGANSGRAHPTNPSIVRVGFGRRGHICSARLHLDGVPVLMSHERGPALFRHFGGSALTRPHQGNKREHNPWTATGAGVDSYPLVTEVLV